FLSMTTLDQFFSSSIPPLFQNLILGGGAVVLGLLIKMIITVTFKISARFWATFQITSILKRLSTPVGFFITLLLLRFSVELMTLSRAIRTPLDKLLEIV